MISEEHTSPAAATRLPRVMTILVTYLPDPSTLRSLVSALAPQVETILVVDNSPSADDRTWSALADLCIDPHKVRIVRIGHNQGIATALNVGIDVALCENFDHVLLSDQDSLPDPAMVQTLTDIYAQLAATDNQIGCIAPEYYDQTTEQAFPFQVQKPGRLFYSNIGGEAAKPWTEILTTITSGSLIPCSTLKEVGLMRDDFFIDHVDTEWCHRARHLGFHLFGTSLTRLTHRLGDEMFRVWCFGWRPYSSYSPLRLYYRFRNFMLLLRLQHVPTLWKIRACWYWLGNLYAHVGFSRLRRVVHHLVCTLV